MQSPNRVIRTTSPFPPAADVKIMHILMVVGRQLKISKPSIRGWGRIPGKNISMHFVIGNPTKNGQAPKVIV